MSGPTAHNILFGGEPNERETLPIDELVEQAEAEDAAAEAGGDAGDDDTSAVDGEGEDSEAGADEEDDNDTDASDAEELDDADDGGDDADGDEGRGEVPEASAEAERQLRFSNQVAAEEAYNEVRAWANSLQNEMQEMQRQMASFQQQNVQSDAPDIASLAQHDPWSAFHAALEHQPEMAPQIIAQVNAQAFQFAAAAQIAAEEGDEETALVNHQRAIGAANLAEQMRDARYQQQQEEYIAPTREREFMQDMNNAAHRAAAAIPGSEEYLEAAGEFVKANPHIMGEMSAPELERGFQFAIRQVMQADMDNIVERKVAEQLERLRNEGRTKGRDRASGGGAGRRAPSAPRPADDEGISEWFQQPNERRSSFNDVFGF